MIMFCLNLSLHYPSKEGEIAYDGCDGGVSEELDRGLDFVNFVYLIFWHPVTKSLMFIIFFRLFALANVSS